MTPEQYNQQVYQTLLKMQTDMAQARAELAEIKMILLTRGGVTGGSSGGAPASPASGPKEGAVADDRDLDGSHGDPTIKFDPSAKYWSGDSFVGYRFSETRADYLDAMAKYLDACAYMAERDTDEKKRKGATYKRRDAARARGWALRLRSGHAPAPVPPANAEDDGRGSLGNEEDLPF